MSGERDLREVTGPTPPAHVAIIMDGNGRWAKSRGLPRIAGHRRGAESVRRAITASAELGISYLTLFGFSSENWKRPSDEVNDLMALLRHYLRGEIAELHQQGVRLLVIGDRVRLAPDIVTLIDNAEQLTRNNKGLTLIVALSYGGRDDIVQASRKLAEDVAAGRIQAKDIDETRLSSSLFTAGIPDPDLLIRTSGEQRISNFLLWQLAYTELVFIETLWPDFGRADLEKAISDYHGRERRYGASAGSG
jgi:undecaprenyl diphosphate synthase